MRLSVLAVLSVSVGSLGCDEGPPSGGDGSLEERVAMLEMRLEMTDADARLTALESTEADARLASLESLEADSRLTSIESQTADLSSSLQDLSDTATTGLTLIMTTEVVEHEAGQTKSYSPRCCPSGKKVLALHVLLRDLSLNYPTHNLVGIPTGPDDGCFTRFIENAADAGTATELETWLVCADS